MRVTESKLVIFCHQKKLSVPDLGYIQLNCCPMGSHGNPQTTHDVAETMSSSLQTDIKVPLLKITPKQLIEHGEAELVSTSSLHPYVPASLVWEGILHTFKRETRTPNQPQTL